VSRSATCDTSVLVPALVAWHPAHERARAAMLDGVAAIPGHVLLECYSVLTRLPVPHRLTPTVAHRALAAMTHPVIELPADRHLEVVRVLAERDIRGGAVYDALVAATARHHGLELVSLDRRAAATYDALGVTTSAP
jgi:predicted nucleic acid-binding protein